MSATNAPTTAPKQGGVMLLEALVAILIFSIGILAVVGMQATAIKTVTDSRYRSEASFLANKLVSQMWTDAANLGSYAYPGSGTPPTRVSDWVGEVGTRLPGAATARPIVTVTGASVQGASVRIEVFWQLPEEAAAGLPPRNHTINASIFI